MTLSKIADTRVHAYPNAGLPNEMGEYDQNPEEMKNYMIELKTSGITVISFGLSNQISFARKPFTLP
mgnify:CR=1 FL=1